MSAPAAASAPNAGARTQRSLATWLSGIGLMAAVSLVGFFATPWLVRWLGDAAWGAWTVVGEWLAYLGLSQVALGPAAMTVFLLRACNQNTPAAFTAVAKRGLRFYLWAALLMAAPAAALAWYAPRGLHAGAGLLIPLRWAVAIAVVSSLALTPAAIFRSVLETSQRGYRVRAALLLQSLLITALSLLLVGLGWGIVGMAAATASGLALGAVLWWRWAQPWLPGWSQTPPAPLSAREVWGVNWPLALALLGNQVNLLTDNTVVGLSLGAAAVTGFALTQSLPLLAGSHIADIGTVSWAALGELRMQDAAAFAERVVELAATILGAGIAAMATIAVLTPGLVALWVGAVHFQGMLLTWATCAALAVYAFTGFFSSLLDTQGDTRQRLPISLLGSALNLGLSLILVRIWGTAGVALGTFLALLATDAWFLPKLAARNYGLDLRALARALGAASLRGGVWAALMVAVAQYWPRPSSWPLLALQAAALGGAFCVYAWSAVLRPSDRAAWGMRLRDLRAGAQ